MRALSSNEIDKLILQSISASANILQMTHKTEDHCEVLRSIGDSNGEEYVKEIITKQFISSLKLELCQRVKPSKSILEALKHSSLMNQSYKVWENLVQKTIQGLNTKILELTVENQKLKERIIQLQESSKEKDRTHNSLLYSASLQKLEQNKYDELKQVEEQEFQSRDNQIEIQILMEKVRHLQEYKEIKEARFAQIIEREAEYVGEINLLKYKNQTLAASVKKLEKSLNQMKSKHVSFAPEQKLTKKKSQNSSKFYQYINQEDSFKSDHQFDQMKEIQHLIVPKENSTLLQSCTQAMNLTDEELLKLKKKQTMSFNEIDLMLREEVHKYKTNSVIDQPQKTSLQNSINVNGSIVAINLNCP